MASENIESIDPEEVEEFDHWINRFWDLQNAAQMVDWEDWQAEIRSQVNFDMYGGECIYCGSEIFIENRFQ